MSKVSASLKFQDHLGLSPQVLQQVLEVALTRGADFSEIFLEHKTFHSIKMEEDIIKETSENIGLGAGIRAISEGKTGFGYTNDLSLGKLQKAAQTAAVIAAGEQTHIVFIRSLSTQPLPSD